MLQSCPLRLSSGDTFSHKIALSTDVNDFSKQAQLSPDGSSILISSESNAICNYAVNDDILNQHRYYKDPGCVSIDTAKSEVFSKSNSLNTGDSIYDFSWYSQMNKASELSCCFATTSRDHPVQLWDSLSGSLRCTYSAFNHLDEMESANSVAFNLSGDKIYCGFNRMIRSFDTTQPGRNCVSQPTSRSKKDRQGQKGIISCFSFNPDFSGAYAAGFYSKTIGVYVENQKECALELQNLDFDVTHMRWSACGNMLWSGGRNYSELVCWDIRSTRSEIGRIPRLLETNQKMYFDLDPWGKYLATGTQHGSVDIFDTQTFTKVHTVRTNTAADVKGSCVHSAIFHPYSSVVLAVTGERAFRDFDCPEHSDGECESGGQSDSNSNSLPVSSSNLHLWAFDSDSISCEANAANTVEENSSIVVDENWQPSEATPDITVS